MKKKKTIRNILIAAAVVIVIAAAIVLAITLRKDGHGLNAFERAATVASADGEKISMIEYALSLDTLLSNNSSSSTEMTDEQLRTNQETAAKQALLVKIYTKEAKALGLTLTEEEEQKCSETAQQQIDAVVENYTKSMISGGSYSKAALDKQIANYYKQIGMNQSRYYAFIRERVEAGYYQEKLDEYYHENGSGLDENEVLEYYRDSVKETMEDYQEGTYSMYMQFYAMGYMSPILFVPEGFIYVDYVQLSKDTEEEINAIIEKLNNGEMTFDELMESEDNKDPYRDKLKAPYAIGKGDFGYLSSEADFYQKAFALNIGEYDSIVVPVKGTAEEGQEAPITGYTGYLFRRAKGDMCEEGDYGIIKIDYYDGVREGVETSLRAEHWTSDLKMDDAMFAYKGIS